MAEGLVVPSFRQTGVGKAGTLKKGKAHTPGVNPASIPTKFETILYDGQEEFDGFYSRTQRFKNTMPDVPGPGAYLDPGSPVKQSDSFSKKGYGVGFVSKSTRWHAVASGPGPGRYEHVDFITDSALRDHARAATSSSFNPPVPKPRVKPTQPLPGPGAYSPAELKHVRRNRVDVLVPRVDKPLTSSGSTTTVRAGSADGGSRSLTRGYTPSTTRLIPAHGDEKHTADAVTSPTRGSSPGRSRRRAKSPVVDQPFLSTTDRFSSAARDVPPPGAYDPKHPSELGPQYQHSHQAAFHSGTVRTSYIDPDSLQRPGPGAYDIGGLKEESKEDAASHMFKKLSVSRFGEPLKRRKAVMPVPGPGHYEPPIPTDIQRQNTRSPSPTHKATPGHKSQRSTPTTSARPDSPQRTGAINSPPPVSTKQTPQAGKTKASPAVSATTPSSSEKLKVPGPAYYNPTPVHLNKKSFHLNAKSTWVS